MTEKKKLWRVTALFKGKVQGVGFRWTVQEHAESLALVGTVTNLRNGTVEVVAEGERAVLEQFIEHIKNEPGLAQILEVSTSYQEGLGEYKNFDIRLSI